MIDYLALTLVHGLLLIGLFRLVQDNALDPEVKRPKRATAPPNHKEPETRRNSQPVHPSKRASSGADSGVGDRPAPRAPHPSRGNAGSNEA